MKIKYFTSAQNTKDFSDFQETWKLPLNTSNQVFHNRLVRSLAMTNTVEVMCTRPLDKNNCTVTSYDYKISEEKNVDWHYLPVVLNKFKNYLGQRKIVMSKKFKKDSTDIVIADCLNIKSLELAFAYAKKNKLPLVGILTDSPSCVQNIHSFEAKCISSLAKRCDAYICITELLNQLVNKKKKPHIQIDGITEDMFREVDVDLKKYGKFFFFAGALSEKYGVYKLIDAFKTLNHKDISLVLCGYNKEERLDKIINESKNIYYIGTLPNPLCLAYESHSFANINPRLYDKLVDKYTVPSKTIEYLSATSLTISTYIKNLYPDFRTSAIWVDDENPLVDALNQALNMSPQERDKMVFRANDIAHQKYSLRANNKKMEPFLNKLIRKK